MTVEENKVKVRKRMHFNLPRAVNIYKSEGAACTIPSGIYIVAKDEE